MQLTVKLFATYRKGRFEVATLERPEGETLGQLLEALSIPLPELGFVLVGGRHAELTDRAADGDVVAVFPKVGGG